MWKVLIIFKFLTFIRNTRIKSASKLCLFLLSVNPESSKREHNYVMKIIKIILTKKCQWVVFNFSFLKIGNPPRVNIISSRICSCLKMLIRNLRVQASCVQFLLSVNRESSKREHNRIKVQKWETTAIIAKAGKLCRKPSQIPSVYYYQINSLQL